MRRVLVSLFCILRQILIPESIFILPIAEPCFFGICVHGFEVESSIVSDKTFESLVMMSCKIIHAEASKACANSTKTVFIYERQIVASVIYGTKIVFHAHAGPIAANLFIPFASEAGQASAIGCYDYVAVSCHYLEVPSVTPELRYRTLRPSFAEQEGRILLCGIKISRKNNPIHHIFAV